MCNTLIGKEKQQVMLSFNPNRSLDFGEIARLCHAACFSPSRRRSGLRRDSACLMTDLGLMILENLIQDYQEKVQKILAR